jgi:hypothetical protein
VVHPDRDYYQAEAVAASPADLGRIDTVVVSQENYDLHALVAAGLREGLQPLRHRLGDSPVDLVRVAIRYALDTAPDAVALVGFRTADQVIAATTGLGDRLTEPEITFVRDTGSSYPRQTDAPVRVEPWRPGRRWTWCASATSPRHRSWAWTSTRS